MRKGYVMEIRVAGSYEYLFVESTSKKATLDAYEMIHGNRPKYAEVIKRGNKITEDKAKEICVNL